MRDRAELQRRHTLAGKLGRETARLLARRPARLAPPRGMVSFSFDDAPTSAAQAAAGILEAAGYRGTYYVCAGFMDGMNGPVAPYADWDAIKALAARGHEIACHTHGHRNCAVIGPDEAVAEAERNRAAFEREGLAAPATFAFPFGDLSAAAKSALAPHYALLRATHPGLMTRGGDLNQTPAVAVEGPQALETAGHWLDAARARNAWVIFFTHDVTDQPSPYGCTPATFRAVVERTKALGLDVVTIAEGATQLSG